mgnify:CR=1 FL=1
MINFLEKLSLTAGLRVDTHNRLGTYLTPRLHLRYTTWDRGSLRASFGRGRRAANIFAENQQLFASARSIQILDTEGSVYGLDPEDAWNYGVSFLQGFTFLNRPGNASIDYYRTDFKNQIVVDWENPRAISFYNLDGKSYASSLQVELNHRIAPNLELRTAYKYYDVETTYVSGKKLKPLTPENRFFANASYETNIKTNGAHWKFDATYNYLGRQRFSSTDGNPVGFRLPEYSPTVSTVNAQITKVFSPNFEIYVGGENITNVKQDNPIMDSDNPFGPNFGKTFVYGPIFGSSYYAGLRYSIN